MGQWRIVEKQPAHRPSRRNDIVDAAIRIFADKGYSEAAITDIAAAVLSRTALMRLLKAEPAVGARLLLAISKRMADRLRETTRKLRTFAQMNKALQQELQVVMNNRTPRSSKKS